MKKLAVIAPCLAPDRSYIRLLDQSADRMGIEVIPHGIGVTFGGWRTMLVSQTIPEIKRLAEEYSHVLYVDGRDSLFIAGIDEIVGKYQLLGSPPCLMSSDDQFPDEAVHINAGGYFAEAAYMADLWTKLASRHEEYNYQDWIQQEWPIAGVVCDDQCAIFQSVEGDLMTMKTRVVNGITGELPCILHFRGGYSDPATGREYRMMPVLKQLYGGDAWLV